MRPPQDLDPEVHRAASFILTLRGRFAAMTGEQIAETLGGDRGGIELAPVTMKRVVQRAVRALRLRGLPVVSGSGATRGYWIATAPGEVRALCKGLDRRARSLYKARRALLKSAWLAWADGQKRLRRRG